MKQRSQANVTDALSADVASGGNWPGLGGMLIGMIVSLIAGAISAILGGFATVIDAIFGTVNDDYVKHLPIIADHTQQLEDLEAAFEQLILQGSAWVFVDGETWTPTAGVLSLEVILIGAGAGGAAGRWDLVAENRYAGAGGGGGGEVHTTIPASLLPKDVDGNFLPITIGIGTGGAGGAADAAPGAGGGNTTLDVWLTAGGGTGGVPRNWNQLGSGGGPGGAGMIPGGRGAHVGIANNGGDSTSAYSLNGGGGGGGAGILGDTAGASTTPSYGGIGGIWPGGAPGQPGTPPSAVVATGGGGGGGSATTTSSGAAGAYPAGGGGGGAGSLAGPRGNGARGGNGIMYIIERFT